MQNRKEFWSKSWKSGSPEATLSIDRPYCKAFHLSPDGLDKINELVYQIIYNSLDEQEQKAANSARNHSHILKVLGNTKVFFMNVIDQLDDFIELEHRVLAAFKGHPFMAEMRAIQLPIDIRVVHPVPPPNYLEKRKAVDFLHTDAWRGEPPDVVNCVLYCAAGNNTSQLQVYDVPEGGIEAFEDYSGPEKEAGFLIEDLEEVNFTHTPGEAVFFDAYTPHHTRRNGSEVRISLNFSFRREDPYEILDERWDRDQQPWCKYWYLPDAQTNSLSARSEMELERLARTGKDKALQLRKDAISKLSVPRKLQELYAG